MANEIRIRTSADVRPIQSLRDLWRKFQKEGSEGVKAGLTAAAAVKGFQLLQQAISKVIGLVGDASDAYIDEERSIRQLDAALRANVAGWDGNTDAIEQLLKVRMKLGFSDDEQRESLRGLVGATGDVTEALAIQRTAMDLARLKGISLAEASEALTKVEAGSYRILKSLGIVLPENATKTQALAAVQRVAEGQAASYAETIEGKLTVAHVRQQEAMEGSGKTASRVKLIWEDFWAGVAEGADNYLERQERLAAAAAALPWNATREELEAYARSLSTTTFEHETLTGQLKKTADHLLIAADLTKDDLIPAFVRGASKGATLASVLGDMGYKADDAEGAIDDLASTISEELFGDAINAGNLAQLRDTHAELVKQRDAAKEGSREYAILSGKIAENEQRLFDLQLQMAQEEGPDAVLAFLDKAYAKYGTNNSRIQTMIDKLRTAYALLFRYADLGVITFGPYSGKIIPGFHEGGRPAPGKPAIVGEKGPELFVPDTAGTIIPNSAMTTASSSGWGGGSPVVLQLVLDGREITRVVDRHLYYAGGRSHYLPD